MEFKWLVDICFKQYWNRSISYKMLILLVFIIYTHYSRVKTFFKYHNCLQHWISFPVFVLSLLADLKCSETRFLLFSSYRAAAQRLIGVINALLGYFSWISVVILVKASLTFDVSSAEVSMKEMFLLFASKAASWVDTVCCLRRSVLLPTNNIIISLFPLCFSSLIQKSTLAKVEYLVIS